MSNGLDFDTSPESEAPQKPRLPQSLIKKAVSRQRAQSQPDPLGLDTTPNSSQNDVVDDMPVRKRNSMDLSKKAKVITALDRIKDSEEVKSVILAEAIAACGSEDIGMDIMDMIIEDINARFTDLFGTPKDVANDAADALLALTEQAAAFAEISNSDSLIGMLQNLIDALDNSGMEETVQYQQPPPPPPPQQYQQQPQYQQPPQQQMPTSNTPNYQQQYQQQRHHGHGRTSIRGQPIGRNPGGQRTQQHRQHQQQSGYSSPQDMYRGPREPTELPRDGRLQANF